MDQVHLHTNAVVNPPPSVFPDPRQAKRRYEEKYRQSIDNPRAFWADIANKEIEWLKLWDKTFTWDFPNYQWFTGGKLNVTVNCLDRHIKSGNGNKIAYNYINEDEEISVTYWELLDKVCRLANGLKSLGVRKGDRIVLYMPLTIEAIVSMLACARIGAIHSVVFAGFGVSALKVRIKDAKSKVIITATSTKRRGEKKDLKTTVNEAIKDLDFVERIVVLKRKGDVFVPKETEVDFDKLQMDQSNHCQPETLKSEDPLFILYTSGTTDKPKGIVHTQGGYLVFAHYTTHVTFDLKPQDVYWCTADIGWITGHSYVVYGPLSNGITSVIMEGAPDYPDPGRWWSLIEKYKVNIFYTAPTAIRMFMKFGEQYPSQYRLDSLRIIGSVGEPINPEAWRWYYKYIGQEKVAVVDTWWQTETGGHAIVTLPALSQKPGRAGLPFYGIEAEIVDNYGHTVPPNTIGNLVIKKPWPGALSYCWHDPKRFNEYWTKINHYYSTGDLATTDDEGYIMILGRSDDVLNVAGHRIGTAEIESALVSHPAVAEAAVIGKPDKVKGELIKAFVILKQNASVGIDRDLSIQLQQTLQSHVKDELGAMAVPSEIEFVNSLPKTRSGKIMRRVLKAKELGVDTGDVSTLEE